jgi:Zn-finger nucleic acid-binding protein
MKCIHCNEDMFSKDVMGIKIDLCPSCAGLWLNSNELKSLTDYELAAGRVLACMKCSKPMQTKLVRGVEIDICPDCSSVWLDGGELRNLSGLDYTAGRILNCPSCDDQLQTKIIRGVEVDVCPQCSGVYLDRGEMEKLSAIEPAAGNKTDIGQFLYDAYQARVELAVKSFREGKYDKGKAADVAGVTQEMFEELVKKAELMDD